VTIAWRPLTGSDRPALIELAARVLAADGGHPMAGAESFLRSRYLSGPNQAAFSGEGLVAVAGRREAGAATGLVDPGWRTRGIGSALVDWALAAGATRIESEGLTADADALFTRRGLRQTFAEDVMAYDLTQGAPATAVDAELREWSPDLQERFFRTYSASFHDRPGFPGWSQEQWVEWISGDEDFAAQWSLLATRDGVDAGFVACGRGAWIVQVGVVPTHRGAGLGAALTAEALRRMRAAGETVCYLDVNTNNPRAIGVYERTGFRRVGRRARYEPA
jgi:mycothiol synthase